MFNEILQKVVGRMDGAAIGAILMDKDGIPVETIVELDGFDVETTAMEYSVVLKDIFKAAAETNAGEVYEVLVKTQRFAALLRILDATYFVALFLEPVGSVGKGRYVLRTAAADLKKEL
jgi:predicted regulator of Ras-like GTPase activity (Roadblock/LC7/MglB family)